MPTKAKLFLAAIALAAPATSFADHYRTYSHGSYRPYCSPYVRYHSYGYYPSYGYYVPAPIVSLTFSSGRPAVYQATRYYEPAATSSLEASVQRALRKRGYYSGPLDGDLGPRSRAAIREYQAEHGLEVNGRVDDPLLRSLGI
jgi:hypothetical protein